MGVVSFILLKSSFQNFEGIFTLIAFPILSCVLGWIIRAVSLGSDYKNISTFKNVVYNFLIGVIVMVIIAVFSELGCNNGGVPIRPD